MSTSTNDHWDVTARAVSFTPDALVVELMDGRVINTPLAWFPKLLHATKKQRKNLEILGTGQGIHWPDMDEYLSVNGLLHGYRPPVSHLQTNVESAAVGIGIARKAIKSQTSPAHPSPSRRTPSRSTKSL